MPERQKQRVARRAIDYVSNGMVLGVGTGTTVNHFIEALADSKIDIAGAVPSSVATEDLLRERGFPVVELNAVKRVDLYVDGADAIDGRFVMIKGGGAALTREKIVASAADRYICIVDQSKWRASLEGDCLPIEVLSFARETVIDELAALGGRATWRAGVVTDSGHDIVDVVGLDFSDPQALEARLDRIPGVVECGLFAFRRADWLIIGKDEGLDEIEIVDG